MADVYKYLIIIGGLTLLFGLLGLPTVSNLIVQNFFDNFEDFKLSNFFDSAWDILTSVGVAGAIVIGYLIRSSPESALLVGYTTLLLSFVADIIAISSLMRGYEVWISSITTVFLVLIAIGYTHSVISWWGGRS